MEYRVVRYRDHAIHDVVSIGATSRLHGSCTTDRDTSNLLEKGEVMVLGCLKNGRVLRGSSDDADSVQVLLYHQEKKTFKWLVREIVKRYCGVEVNSTADVSFLYGGCFVLKRSNILLRVVAVEGGVRKMRYVKLEEFVDVMCRQQDVFWRGMEEAEGVDWEKLDLVEDFARPGDTGRKKPITFPTMRDFLGDEGRVLFTNGGVESVCSLPVVYSVDKMMGTRCRASDIYNVIVKCKTATKRLARKEFMGEEVPESYPAVVEARNTPLPHLNARVYSMADRANSSLAEYEQEMRRLQMILHERREESARDREDEGVKGVVITIKKKCSAYVDDPNDPSGVLAGVIETDEGEEYHMGSCMFCLRVNKETGRRIMMRRVEINSCGVESVRLEGSGEELLFFGGIKRAATNIAGVFCLRGRYAVEISYLGRTFYMGRFDTLMEAITKRKEAEERFYGSTKENTEKQEEILKRAITIAYGLESHRDRVRCRDCQSPIQIHPPVFDKIVTGVGSASSSKQRKKTFMTGKWTEEGKYRRLREGRYLEREIRDNYVVLCRCGRADMVLSDLHHFGPFSPFLYDKMCSTFVDWFVRVDCSTLWYDLCWGCDGVPWSSCEMCVAKVRKKREEEVAARGRKMVGRGPPPKVSPQVKGLMETAFQMGEMFVPEVGEEGEGEGGKEEVMEEEEDQWNSFLNWGEGEGMEQLFEAIDECTLLS
jgi:hypothetical protein